MINIYNQDCMEAMKEMSENQFDLAIVDPPFGIGNFVQTIEVKRLIGMMKHLQMYILKN